jgi:hypothetical protein
MHRIVTPLLGVSLLAAPALAQEPMKPGPEHARLGYFAGTWQFEGEAKASPMGPAGKLSGTDTCEWFAGGFHLVCRGDGTGPRGANTGESIWGYDGMQQRYTYFGHNSLGDGFYVLGTAAGKVWTWTTEFPVEGGKVQARVTLTEESPTAYTYRFEMSPDGTNWTVVEDGRATKRGR